MSNYTKTTNFAAKDSLPSGNAAKIVKGAEIDTEFNNIATASATKANANNAALTGTTVFETLSDGTIGVTGWVDEDNMSSNSAVLIPTQQSVKAYVDSQVTAQDLDVTDGSTSIDIDLDSESLGILGGTGITSSASGTGVTLAIDSTVTTLTGTQTLTNKTLTSPTLTTPTITTSFTIGSATITEAELEILDGATVTTAELNVLDGITSTTAELNILDGVTSTAAELNILDGVTSTAAELNILDGVTSTTAELNILDGVTSTAAELNILDGVTSTATELNILDGVTATTAEINYVDGVTSNVQTQLNTKAPIAGATFTGTTTIPTADINGGAIDGTVIGGSTAAAGSFTTLGASGAITGTLGTAAQTNITSVGTLSALTVSGNLTVDTNSLKVDSSNNRVGILNASPDVTLDIGTATDAVHMPTGTTAQRPTGAAGYFRYNSTLEQFEGYTDAWGAIGGGGGSNLVSDTMTGDGSDTTLTLSNDPLNENNTQVYIDGVYQNKDTYSVSGTTLTFSAAPPNGSAVEAMTIQPTAVNVPADASVTSAKLSGALTTPSDLTVTGTFTSRGIDDNADATAITLNADESSTFAGPIILTAGALAAAGNAGLSHRSADNKVYLQAGTGGFNILDDQQNTHFSIDSGGAATFNSTVTINTDANSSLSIVDAGTNAVIIKAGASDELYIGANNTYALRVLGDGTNNVAMDNGGNLLVGGTSTNPTGQNVAGAAIDASGEGNFSVDGAEALRVNRKNSDGTIVNFMKDATSVGSIGTVSNGLYIASPVSSDSGLRFSGSTVHPCTTAGAPRDAAIDLGYASGRFRDVYRSGSTIGTSDRNMKQDIRDLTDAERNVAVAAKGLLKAFRFIDRVEEEGESANIHFGIIAQDLADAFTAEGLDANDYQVYRSDTWTDDEGNEQTRLGICYENLLAFIIAAI